MAFGIENPPAEAGSDRPTPLGIPVVNFSKLRSGFTTATKGALKYNIHFI
jgi:hypothetical protein